jgi:hypothetical protein
MSQDQKSSNVYDNKRGSGSGRVEMDIITRAPPDARKILMRIAIVADHISRPFLFIALIVAVWGISEATDEWKTGSVEGGLEAFENAGWQIAHFNQRPVRDLVHDALWPATSYFAQVHQRALILMIVRDCTVILLVG